MIEGVGLTFVVRQNSVLVEFGDGREGLLQGLEGLRAALGTLFGVFSADEETFVNTQLWKNLLRETCTVPLWSGVREAGGQTAGVQVWGNRNGVVLN